MKLISVVLAGLSLSFAGQAFAAGTPVALTDAQLDAVVAGTDTSEPTHYGNRGSRMTCFGCGLVNVLNGSLNGNAILSGNQVNVLNGNNAAVGVGILGTGISVSTGGGGHYKDYGGGY